MTRHHTSIRDRLVRSPSAKQKENARAFVDRGHADAKIVFGPPRGSGLPTASWWLNQDRQGFSAKAREQRDRMINSKFAQVTDPTYRSE